MDMQDPANALTEYKKLQGERRRLFLVVLAIAMLSSGIAVWSAVHSLQAEEHRLVLEARV